MATFSRVSTQKIKWAKIPARIRIINTSAYANGFFQPRVNPVRRKAPPAVARRSTAAKSPTRRCRCAPDPGAPKMFA